MMEAEKTPEMFLVLPVLGKMKMPLLNMNTEVAQDFYRIFTHGFTQELARNTLREVHAIQINDMWST